MSGSLDGALKTAAARRDMSVEAYLSRCITEKWCTRCKAWHPHGVFGTDRSRGDGLAQKCLLGARYLNRASYLPQPRPFRPMGPPANPPRDGDKKQARRRINVEVRCRRRVHPNTLPCTDCGHVWTKGERRHEYDHYRGYTAEHHYDVQPVCTRCHSARDKHPRRKERAAR